jgi:hypothetical protein
MPPDLFRHMPIYLTGGEGYDFLNRHEPQIFRTVPPDVGGKGDGFHEADQGELLLLLVLLGQMKFSPGPRPRRQQSCIGMQQSNEQFSLCGSKFVRLYNS